MDDTTSQPAGNTRGISLIGLIALVISSSIGSGVFALSTDISAAAAPGPALIAWLITGIGFMALATTFGRLSVVRPDLNGIVDYAREGFGPFVGLVSGWGYWLSIWIGNVAFGVMLVTAIGYFFPPFSSGLTAAGAASILPYGYLTREELMALGSPSMPYIFERVVGPWGGAFISGGLIISIFGAWLSYTILASEAMHGMARMKLLPSAFDWLNTYSAPTACLFTTGAMIQLLSIVMLFSERAYQFAYSLCTASIAISWTLAAAYMAKAWLAQERRQGASEAPRIRAVDGICAACSAAFLIVAIAVSGVEQLMMCCIAYIPGIACYIWARVEQRQKVFTARERLLAFLLVAIGIFMIGYVAANGIL